MHSRKGLDFTKAEEVVHARKCTRCSIDLEAMALAKKSAYFSSLSTGARKRYEGS